MIITASKIDFPQPSRRSSVGLWFVCFSFLLHVLIIGLLSHRNSERPVVESLEETQVIEATLIFPKLPEIPSEPSTLQPATKAEERIDENQAEVSETQAEELIDSLSNTEPVPIPSKPLNENAKPAPPSRAKALSSQGFTQRYMQQRNVEQLKSDGVAFFGPDENGMLACGYEGKGRLMPVDTILEEIRNQLS